MRKLDKPTLLCEDVFAICISKVRVKAHKLKLQDATVPIKTASNEFDSKVTTGTLHTIIRKKANGILTVDDLEKVYTGRMAAKGSPGRAMYDDLLLKTVLGICPMCGHRDATELDHYLPKTQYPLLTTNPLNLVPCCSECNGLKGDDYPKKDYQEFVHPYYDDIDQDKWLRAKIKRSSPCSFHFYVDPPTHWAPLLKDRLTFHFEKLELAKLYTVQAGRELALKKYILEKLHKINSKAVKKHLEEEAKSCANFNINSWQSVFYETAAQSAWFCGGGFANF